MATTTINHATAATITCAVASLASSVTFVSGRASTAIDNTTDKYLDVLVNGKVTVGTGPDNNKQIQIWVYSAIDETPTYPDNITGTDAAKSMTSAGVLRSGLELGAIIEVDTITNDRVYFFAPFSIAQLYGGVMPKFWGLYVAQNTAVALHVTGSNHEFEYVGVKFDVTA